MGSGKGAVVRRRGDNARVSPSDALVPDYPTPTGLTNVGNTCYANAALQCLLNTALTEVLLEPKTVHIFRQYSSNHLILSRGSGSVDSEDNEEEVKAKRARREERRKARDDRRRLQETCSWLTRELTQITREYTRESTTHVKPTPSYLNLLACWPPTTTNGHNVVNPGSVTKNPQRLSTCLKPYQQEDAHEFLRALLSTLVMNGHNKHLSSLFDGLLESAVTCHCCDRSSLTRDRYMDLSLDISHACVKTLPDALYEFTKTEILDGDNKVMCDKCGVKQKAAKRLLLATAPSILVCHLKRFAYNRFGRLQRLSKHVDFPLRLEIGDYMSRVNKATPPPYELVSVLVHQGRSCDSGHYVSYVKSGNEWFKADDSVVTKVSVETVLRQEAYILVYEVAEMRNEHKVSKLSKRMSRRPPPQERRPSDESLISQDPISENDEHSSKDKGCGSSPLMSLLCNAASTAQAMNEAFVSGDICCRTSQDDLEDVRIYDDDLEPTDSPPSSPKSCGGMVRKSRRDLMNAAKCVSSSNLQDIRNKSSKAYSTRIPALLHVPPSERPRPRNGYSHRSDPGRFPRRSKRQTLSPARRDLPPRPAHRRSHSQGCFDKS